MAEYSTNRLYWIKLTDRFMTSDTVDYLLTQPDGANYVVLYQMLCLKTVNNNGVLARQLGEIIIPYDVDKIQRDCRYFSIDTVRIALTLYKNLGLIYEQEDGLFRIADFERLIGSTTEGAEKKQIQREKNAKKNDQISGGQGGGQKVDICPPDKEKDKDYIESKKENINNNIISTQRVRARTCVGVREGESENACVSHGNYRTHEQVMADLYVSEELRTALRDFLRHCYLNGCIKTNDELESIIFRLDLHYRQNEQAKCDSVRRAIQGGFFDIAEGHK